MNSLPSKEELLAFQARWMRPAGISALLGALVIAASLPLQPSTGGDSDAERLTTFHDQSTELIVGQGVLIGLGILLFIPVLYVLIRSVVGRTERVRRGMVALAFVGPILFSLSGLLVAIGLNDVADKFVEQAPAKERQAREQAVAAPKRDDDSAEQGLGNDHHRASRRPPRRRRRPPLSRRPPRRGPPSRPRARREMTSPATCSTTPACSRSAR